MADNKILHNKFINTGSDSCDGCVYNGRDKCHFPEGRVDYETFLISCMEQASDQTGIFVMSIKESLKKL